MSRRAQRFTQAAVGAAVLVLVACRHGDRREQRAASEAGAAVASHAPAPKERADAAPGEKWAALARGVLARARVPGAGYARVAEGDIRCGAVGLADASTGAVADAATVFPAASLAKPIVAALVLRAQSEGRLRLDDDVTHVLPTLAGAPHRYRPLTARRLLLHTAGLRDDVASQRAKSKVGDPPAELATFLAGELARMRPEDGPAPRYSNLGYALLAVALERAVGEPFEARAERELFRPLQMTAAFRVSAIPPARRAAAHVWREGRFVAEPPIGRPVYPASDLRTDVCGFARFVARLVGTDNDGTLPALSRDVVAALRGDGAIAAGGATERREPLGLQRIVLGGRTLLGHEGEDDGVSSIVVIDPARRRGAVVLANGDAFASGSSERAGALSDLVVRLLDD